jgi:hypothetical protein
MSENKWEVSHFKIGPGEVYKGRFEYRVEKRPRSTDPMADGAVMSGPELAEWLKALGLRGWQLCAEVKGSFGSPEFIFKRELP